MSTDRGSKYTLVQHSGYGYAGKPEFQAAVELKEIKGKEIDKVKRAGGAVFDDYREGSEAETRENYPPGVVGLIPNVRGRFHKTVSIDRLKVYLPDPKLGLVRPEEAETT